MVQFWRIDFASNSDSSSFGAFTYRVVAHLALQRTLGILPERRAGFDFDRGPDCRVDESRRQDRVIRSASSACFPNQHAIASAEDSKASSGILKDTKPTCRNV